MTVKNIKTQDFYATLTKWWEGHNFPVLGLDFLPEETFVCFNGDVPIYSVCLYHTDSYLCWIAFPVSDPSLDKEIKEGGLEALINGVTEYAKQSGYKYVFTTSPVKIVQDTLTATGFGLGDQQSNHYLKIIG